MPAHRGYNGSLIGVQDYLEANQAATPVIGLVFTASPYGQAVRKRAGLIETGRRGCQPGRKRASAESTA